MFRHSPEHYIFACSLEPHRRSASPGRGFTVPELLVAIMIVAIVAMLCSVAFTTAKKVGDKARCLAQLRDLGTAAALFMAENNNKLPPVSVEPVGLWYDHLHVYIGRKPGRAGRFDPDQKSGNPWWCPASKRTSTRYTYGVNEICGSFAYVQRGMAMMPDAKTVLPIAGPLSRTAWFADCLDDVYFKKPPSSSRLLDWCHFNTANVLFMDGHAESVKNPDFDQNQLLPTSREWTEFFGR